MTNWLCDVVIDNKVMSRQCETLVNEGYGAHAAENSRIDVTHKDGKIVKVAKHKG
jgi:hypothetical protein